MISVRVFKRFGVLKRSRMSLIVLPTLCVEFDVIVEELSDFCMEEAPLDVDLVLLT